VRLWKLSSDLPRRFEAKLRYQPAASFPRGALHLENDESGRFVPRHVLPAFVTHQCGVSSGPARDEGQHEDSGRSDVGESQHDGSLTRWVGERPPLRAGGPLGSRTFRRGELHESASAHIGLRTATTGAWHVHGIAGTLNFTRFRLRDVDSVDRIRFRADYALGAGGNGINPAGEPVRITLSTPAGGQFYPSPDFNPLIGFAPQGPPKKQRWTLSDAERARTGIEQLIFDEGPNNSGAIVLRDFRTNLVDASFSVVNVEIAIGTGATQDKLTGTAYLVEKPWGRWRLDTEP
jgi:hypothetical protein